MKRTKKILHVAAIMLSSMASMLTHGHAKAAEMGTKNAKKSTKSELSKAHKQNGGVVASSASEDPPLNSSGGPAKKLSSSLMMSAERSTPMALPRVITPTARPGDENSRYAWKNGIVTTTFWIGEKPSQNNPVPNHASSWDKDWAKKYGGTDDPNVKNRTSEYTPAAFTPGQNPFYIALPYNDIQMGGHKPEASKVIPWFNQEFKGKYKSVCKGRWLAIRFGNKVCYAQWEDAGPFRTDHWQYVFGKERPKPNLNKGAGLDVSPAVRDYLGMNSTDVTDWKFVDFDEVPEGPWSKYGENNTFVQNRRKGIEVAQNMATQSQNKTAGPIVTVR